MQNLVMLIIPPCSYLYFFATHLASLPSLPPPLLRELFFSRAFYHPYFPANQPLLPPPWSTRFSFFFSRQGRQRHDARKRTHTHTHSRDRVSLMQGKKCNNYNTNDPIQPTFPFPRVDNRWSFTPLFLYCYWCCCLCPCLPMLLFVGLCASFLGIVFFLFPSVRASVCVYGNTRKINGSCYYEKNFFPYLTNSGHKLNQKTMRVVFLLVNIF